MKETILTLVKHKLSNTADCKPPSQSHTAWTDDDNRLLKELYLKNYKMQLIAVRMGRSKAAVEKQLTKILKK